MPPENLSWLVGELRALAGDLTSDDAHRPLVVAIDQGGHATRALAFEAQGRLVAESFVPISTFRSGTDHVEHDAIEVDESVRAALSDLHQTLADEAGRVSAFGLATQRSSIACWDLRTHKPLAPILSWQDRRHAAYVEQLRPHEQTIRSTTGLVLSPHYGASKMRWCLENIDAVSAAAAKKSLALGPLAARLLHSQTNERSHVVDAVDAARTQLLDIRSHTWSSEMLDLFGIARELLPVVVPNRHDYGRVAFGDRLVPLVVCTGDQSAMPFAHGRPDESTIYLNLGTGAFVQRLSAAAQAPEGLLASVLWVDHGNDRAALHAIEGTVNGAGSAIDWLNERIGIDTNVRTPAWTHRAALSMTRSQAANSRPPLFLNGVSGVGSPYWRAQFESRFIGDGNATERLLAVMESIAFLIVINIERMRAGATRIRASGGLAASDYLCECVATLSGLPVERTSLQESTAAGLAFLVANEPEDWHPDAKLEHFMAQPDPPLSERFERWRRAMG